MAFLARAEDIYLNVLRVVILAIASLAILAAGLGFGFGAWLYIANSMQTTTHAAPVAQSTLGDYMQEQKITSTDSSTGQPTTPSDPSVTVPIALDRAARDVVSYVNAHHLPYPKEVAELSIVLNDQYKALPSAYQDSYGDSVQSISHQLFISKGAPLTGDQVIALLKWHYDKFTAAVAADQASRAAKTATGQQLVTAAGAAFLGFLLLVFCFIFVKIERNLRVMKTLTKVVGTAP